MGLFFLTHCRWWKLASVHQCTQAPSTRFVWSCHQDASLHIHMVKVKEDSLASAVFNHLVRGPTIQHSLLDFPCQAIHGHHQTTCPWARADFMLTYTNEVLPHELGECDVKQTMNYVVDMSPVTKFDSRLLRLYRASEWDISAPAISVMGLLHT